MKMTIYAHLCGPSKYARVRLHRINANVNVILFVLFYLFINNQILSLIYFVHSPFLQFERTLAQPTNAVKKDHGKKLMQD